MARNDGIMPFLRRHKREVELVALGVFLAGAGVLVSLILSEGDRRGIEIIENGVAGENSGLREIGLQDLVVDVAGAVISPGVYRLPADSRFGDGLAAAGGLAAGADRDWVSRNINLAQNITDGIKIYIPTIGESEVRGQGSDSRAPILSSGIISINTASLSELDGLWGVGEARARAIIEGRPYSSLEELVSRKILPENVVERNRERLRL